MTGGEDPPRRWADDSPEEDFEAHRATEEGRLEQRIAGEKTQPLADALESHGVRRGNPGEGWAGPLVVPEWWDAVPAPPDPCPWCQRQVPASPCPECRAARVAGADPAAIWAWWESLAPARRRLNIAAQFSTDPWSGRHCAIRQEWTDLDSDGQVRTAHPLYFGCAPAGIFWGARRRSGLA